MRNFKILDYACQLYIQFKPDLKTAKHLVEVSRRLIWNCLRSFNIGGAQTSSEKFKSLNDYSYFNVKKSHYFLLSSFGM